MKDTASTCLNCDKVIRSGRIDKKFCGEACKNEFHNAEKIREHAAIKKIDLALKKNRRILKRLLAGRQEEMFPKSVLVKAGFDFDLHTHHLISKVKQMEYIFCYDYGYRSAEKDQVKVVKSFK
jgi:hypothetical protein